MKLMWTYVVPDHTVKPTNSNFAHRNIIVDSAFKGQQRGRGCTYRLLQYPDSLSSFIFYSNPIVILCIIQWTDNQLYSPHMPQQTALHVSRH
jgi:hypothetical protein